MPRTSCVRPQVVQGPGAAELLGPARRLVGGQGRAPEGPFERVIQRWTL